jgi:two-component system phosphate regulon response regulator PhoB
MDTMKVNDETATASPLLRRYRVLVIDDERDFRQLITMFLQRSGMPVDVEVAASGPEGLAMAQANPPHLLLLDVMMPGMSGFDVCQRLRADARTHDTPVLMLTSLDEPIDRTRGFLSGVDDYLAKPFDRGELLARVRRILQRSCGYGEVATQPAAAPPTH